MKEVTKALKKPRFIAIALFALFALAAIYLLTVRGLISADANSTYIFNGYLSGSTSVGNLTIQNVSPQRLLSGTKCGGLTATSNFLRSTNSNGAFVFTGIKPGCYTFKSSNKLETFSIIIPANSPNKWIGPVTGSKGTRLSAYLKGTAATPTASATRTSARTATATTSAVATHDVSAYLVDADGNPLAGRKIVNVSPQNNLSGSATIFTGGKLVSGCSSATVRTTSASAITDSAGKFTMKNMPAGCFTWQITVPCPAGQACPTGWSVKIGPVKVGSDGVVIDGGGQNGPVNIVPRPPKHTGKTPPKGDDGALVEFSGQVKKHYASDPIGATSDAIGYTVVLKYKYYKDKIGGVLLGGGELGTTFSAPKYDFMSKFSYDPAKTQYFIAVDGKDGCDPTEVSVGSGQNPTTDIVLNCTGTNPTQALLFTGKVTINGATPASGFQVLVMQSDVNGIPSPVSGANADGAGVYKISAPVQYTANAFGILVPASGNCPAKYEPITGGPVTNPDGTKTITTNVNLTCVAPPGQ